MEEGYSRAQSSSWDGCAHAAATAGGCRGNYGDAERGFSHEEGRVRTQIADWGTLETACSRAAIAPRGTGSSHSTAKRESGDEENAQSQICVIISPMRKTAHTAVSNRAIIIIDFLQSMGVGFETFCFSADTLNFGGGLASFIQSVEQNGQKHWAEQSWELSDRAWLSPSRGWGWELQEGEKQ